jgi:hypothetical protein
MRTQRARIPQAFGIQHLACGQLACGTRSPLARLARQHIVEANQAAAQRGGERTLALAAPLTAVRTFE